jgi:hypothetical protein
MRGKSLNAALLSDIPQFGIRIASARDKLVGIQGIYAQTHDISQMIRKLVHPRTRLNIPEHTGHVARRCENSPVIDESAAAEVARVTGKLPGDTCGSFSCREVVNGADVVQTAAGDVITARGVGAGHDPRGSQGNSVEFVGSVSVPDDELSVLRGGDQMSSVGRPVHCVYFCEMPSEGLFRPHRTSIQFLDGGSRDITHCTMRRAN